MLYALNFYIDIRQLFFNKTGKKTKHELIDTENRLVV